MVLPAKYSYKSAKAVTAVTFTDERGAGYWSTVGPYTSHCHIQPRGDFPQALPGERKQIEGSEITSNGNPTGTHCWHLQKCQDKKQVEFHCHLRVEHVANQRVDTLETSHPLFSAECRWGSTESLQSPDDNVTQGRS